MSSNLELEAARAVIDDLTRRLRESEGAAAVMRHHLARIEALLDGAAGDPDAQVNVMRAHKIASIVPAEHDAGRAFLDRLVHLESQVAQQTARVSHFGAPVPEGALGDYLQLLAFAVARGKDQGLLVVSDVTIAEAHYDVWIMYDQVEGETKVSVMRKGV